MAHTSHPSYAGGIQRGLIVRVKTGKNCETLSENYLKQNGQMYGSSNRELA